MPKKEKTFPLTTVGGRIQDLRHKANLSRSGFYDRVYPYGEAGSDSSKDKTVYDWESETTQLDYGKMIAVSKTLDCDTDYLLGLQETPRKEYAHISEMTGLSPAAAKYLFELKERFPLDQTLLATLSEMIIQTMQQEERESDRSLWHYLDYFMQTDYFPHQRNADTTDTNDRDYEADWGALNRELGNFTHDYRRKRWHTD